MKILAKGIVALLAVATPLAAMEFDYGSKTANAEVHRFSDPHLNVDCIVTHAAPGQEAAWARVAGHQEKALLECYSSDSISLDDVSEINGSEYVFIPITRDIDRQYQVVRFVNPIAGQVQYIAANRESVLTGDFITVAEIPLVQ